MSCNVCEYVCIYTCIHVHIPVYNYEFTYMPTRYQRSHNSQMPYLYAILMCCLPVRHARVQVQPLPRPTRRLLTPLHGKQRSKRPDRHEDTTKQGFWHPLCIGPWSRNPYVYAILLTSTTGLHTSGLQVCK